MHISHHLLIACISLSPLAQADALNEQAKQLAQSPHPAVFRSVLNKRPRMLNITLDDQHAISYDTWNGMLGFAWKVDSGPLIKIGGSVYTQQHGPQSSTLGTIVIENFEAEFNSPLGELQYLGHAFRKGKTILRYGIKNEEHQLVATIEEIPEFQDSILKRSFRVLPANLGSKISFTPAVKAKWKKGNSTFTSGSLATPLTISTTL